MEKGSLLHILCTMREVIEEMESRPLVWRQIKLWNWVHLGISWLSQQARLAMQCPGPALPELRVAVSCWKVTPRRQLNLCCCELQHLFTTLVVLQNFIVGHRRAVEKPNPCYRTHRGAALGITLVCERLGLAAVMCKDQILFSSGKS